MLRRASVRDIIQMSTLKGFLRVPKGGNSRAVNSGVINIMGNSRGNLWVI